jgi:hypothetical protein
MPIGTLSNFPQGFANGITVRNVPIVQAQPGQVFWLNNSSALLPQQRAGSDGNRGTFLDPFATLSYASSQCVAGRGDTIMVGSGHAETISSATALSLGISGVAVVGMGSGSLRPAFTLNTAATATINVTADNISFQNCVFVANFANITSLFTLTTAKYFNLANCYIYDTSAVLNFLSLITTSTTSNVNDGMSLYFNDINLKATSGIVNLVSFLGTQDNVTIVDNSYQALTTNAGAIMPIASGKVLTNFFLEGNYFNIQNATGTSTGYLITTNGSTNSGVIANNKLQALPTSPLLVTASSGFAYSNNLHSDQPDTSGYLLPAADS